MFIKDMDIAETWSNYTLSYVNHHLGEVHKNEFTMWNAAYLDKDSTMDDLDTSNDSTGQISSPNMMHGMVKYYA